MHRENVAVAGHGAWLVVLFYGTTSVFTLQYVKMLFNAREVTN